MININKIFLFFFGLYVKIAINIKAKTAKAQGFIASTAAREKILVNVSFSLLLSIDELDLAIDEFTIVEVLFSCIATSIFSPFH